MSKKFRSRSMDSIVGEQFLNIWETTSGIGAYNV